MTLKRCIEDDPGYAGIEKWMRSQGDGWEPVLLAQQRAMFPRLCEYTTLVLSTEATGWIVKTPPFCFQIPAAQVPYVFMDPACGWHWPCNECGVAIGAWRVAHDVCVENGVTLSSWHPRIRMVFPHLCRDSAGLFAQEMGLW